MIAKIFRKIKTFSLLVKLASAESNDYFLGHKVRRVLNLYRENKKIKEEEILNEKPNP